MQLGRDTRVLITGGSSGIGRALAVELASRDCRLGLLARRAGELERLAAELREANSGGVMTLPADVGDREQVQRAVRSFAHESGGLDLLVVNAGIAIYGPFRDAPLEAAETMTRVNWLGTLYTVGAGLPLMLDRGRGHVVVVSSAAGFRAFPWAAVYGATKFAQRGFVDALRHELSGTGVALTGVYPGEVETHLHDEDREHGRMPDWYRPGSAIPPQRVASAIVEAVEQGHDAVFVPPITRLLRVVHGISPKLSDRMLRVIMNGTAAPHR